VTAPVIVAENLSKCFFMRHNRAGELKVRFLGLFHRRKREVIEEFWALRGISATIGHGEAVGLVGRNGSGKSTFLKLVAGLHRPTGGRLLVSRGARIGTMIELGVGFHGELSGRENVFLNASIYGLSRTEIEAMYPTIVEYSGLEHFMDVPLKNYSSGMHMRLGFAIAAQLDPDILLLDEIFAVGDSDFQQQCMRTLTEFRGRGKTILFVSHSAHSVRAICDRVLVLDQGHLMFDGAVEDGLDYYARLASGLGPTLEAAGAAR
jgi:ABC-type polysaccharide/polyol phosphate transport system ATPase subunit